MDREVKRRFQRSLIEGTAEGLEGVALAHDLAFNVIVIATASEAGVAVHFVVDAGAVGAPPDGALDAFNVDVKAAIENFLRKCPNVKVRPENAKGGEPWNDGSN
jgi:hypothetical protein